MGALQIKVRLVGDRALAKRLRALAKAYPKATGDALFKEGLEIQRLAVQNAPVKTGNLRRSADTVRGETQKGPQVLTGFGIVHAVEYAAPVHELHETKAKFLERAVNARADGMAARLADAIEAAAKRAK